MVKMFDHRLASYTASGFGGFSQGSSWRERRYKRNEDRRWERDGEQSSSGEGSSRTYQIVSGISEHEHRDRRDQEIERLRRMVRNLEIEVRGICRRRNRDEHAEGSVSIGGSHGEASRQSSSHWSRDRSWDYIDRDSASPERRRPLNATF